MNTPTKTKTDSAPVIRPADAHEALRRQREADERAREDERIRRKAERQEQAMRVAEAEQAAARAEAEAAAASPERMAARRVAAARSHVDDLKAQLGAIVLSGATEDECQPIIDAIQRARVALDVAEAAQVAAMRGDEQQREAERRADRKRVIAGEIGRLEQVARLLDEQAAIVPDLIEPISRIRAMPGSIVKPTLREISHDWGRLTRVGPQLAVDADNTRAQIVTLRAELAALEAAS